MILCPALRWDQIPHQMTSKLQLSSCCAANVWIDLNWQKKTPIESVATAGPHLSSLSTSSSLSISRLLICFLCPYLLGVSYFHPYAAAFETKIITMILLRISFEETWPHKVDDLRVLKTFNLTGVQACLCADDGRCGFNLKALLVTFVQSVCHREVAQQTSPHYTGTTCGSSQDTWRRVHVCDYAAGCLLIMWLLYTETDRTASE